MAWKGLTGQRSLHPPFKQGFRLSVVLPSLLHDVLSVFPVFGQQFSGLFKLLLTHKGAETPFPSAFHMWIASTSSAGFQVAQQAKQGKPQSQQLM